MHKRKLRQIRRKLKEEPQPLTVTQSFMQEATGDKAFNRRCPHCLSLTQVVNGRCQRIECTIKRAKERIEEFKQQKAAVQSPLQPDSDAEE
jgi:transcription initiation factor IIF auxiliary subunit